MNILQVSMADVGGGAEKMARGLFSAYRGRGHRSRLIVGYRTSNDPDIALIPSAQAARGWSRFWWWWDARSQGYIGRVRGARRLSRLARRLAEPSAWSERRHGTEDFNFPGTKTLLSTEKRLPDVVHCHNLHGDYFDLRALPVLSKTVPLVMTLHDGWLFSGHCAHSFGCTRWLTGCGLCPDLRIYPAIRRDATAENWRRKHDIYAQCHLWITTPSRWLLDRARHSMLAAAIVDARVIPNGVDLSIFHPGDQTAARQAVGVPPEGRVVLMAGHTIRHNEWKDYPTLATAIQALALRTAKAQLIFVVLGEAGPPERFGLAEVWHIGFKSDPAVVAQYYQAADVYMHAARVDTFPTTVLEALACGTPVVATAVGGIPEQIDEGETGFLTPAGDGEAMAARAATLLNQLDLRRQVGGRAAEIARLRFDLEQQVDRYLGWYDDVIGQFHSQRND